MKIFFDVDYTLISDAWPRNDGRWGPASLGRNGNGDSDERTHWEASWPRQSSLRPHVLDVFKKIADEGHEIFIWSGVGERWEVVERHGLKPFIQTCYVKPLSNYRDLLSACGVPFVPDLCIDDYPGVVDAFGGTLVKPHYAPDHNDREMLRVYDEIRKAPSTGP